MKKKSPSHKPDHNAIGDHIEKHPIGGFGRPKLPKREARYLTILKQTVQDCRCQPQEPRGCALCSSARKILKLPYYNLFGRGIAA